MQRAGNGSDWDGFNHQVFENFEAIPEEFRPSKHGKDLLKVVASPKKGDSGKEWRQNERHQITSSELQRKRGSRNSNSSTIQNESRNFKKESLKIEDSEQPQRDSNLIFDETGKQKKLSGIFFYTSSETAKVGRGCHQNGSGKESSRAESSENSKLKNMQDEITQSKYFNSNSSQAKATKEFDIHSTFGNKVENKFPKFNKKPLFNYQDTTASSQNKVSFVERGIYKLTQGTTLTKRIQWKSDLCRSKESEIKPNIFCEYTKTTKQSMSCIPPHSEEDDEVTERLNKDFKKARLFSNDFHRTCSVHHNDEPKRRFENRKGFDSTNKPQRKETKQFVPERPQKPDSKFEENHNYFQCYKGKDTIIVRHEIKVVHVNGHGKNNRMFHNSFQTIRPPKKDRNGRIINTGDRPPCDTVMDKTGKNTMTKAAGTYKKTRKNYERPLLKAADSTSKTEYAHDAVSLTSNSDYNENAATLLEYGREISNVIVGSSIASSTFLCNYEQWKDIRRVTMLLFEEFEKTLSQSCNRNKRIIEVTAMVGTGCKMVQYVPHAGVSIAAKVIACLSDIVTRMFSSSKSAKSLGMDDFQLKLCLQRDMDATSDIYLYGLQCDLQFQETCEIIEEFHSKIKDGLFEKFVETFETGFLKEISLLNPKHPEVFYTRLERYYKLLKDRQQSEEGEAFCKAFEDWSDALTIISRLPRRFKTGNWDSSPALKTWEEIYNLLQNDQSAVEDVLKKIQDCICVLMQEQSVIDKYVMDLQR